MPLLLTGHFNLPCRGSFLLPPWPCRLFVSRRFRLSTGCAMPRFEPLTSFRLPLLHWFYVSVCRLVSSRPEPKRQPSSSLICAFASRLPVAPSILLLLLWSAALWLLTLPLTQVSTSYAPHLAHATRCWVRLSTRLTRLSQLPFVGPLLWALYNLVLPVAGTALGLALLQFVYVPAFVHALLLDAQLASCAASRALDSLRCCGLVSPRLGACSHCVGYSPLVRAPRLVRPLLDFLALLLFRALSPHFAGGVSRLAPAGLSVLSDAV